MKRLLMSTAFALMLASPAFAQSYSHDFGSGNVLNMPAAESSGAGFGAGLNANASASDETLQSTYAPRHIRHRVQPRPAQAR